MAVLSKPIPALYTVYILRSTVRHASLYIGSTPHPPRRLKQHNGEVRGGAARTSRQSLRPWEMVAIVSGFPGMVAALKFEWALTNPHLSLHIPSTSRITISTGRKKNGHPRRPRQNMASILSNVNILLGVPSFKRWPLKLHFFAREVHSAWKALFSSTEEALQPEFGVATDFGPAPDAAVASKSEQSWGIHALPLDYAPMKGYVEKVQSIVSFEREGKCVVCAEDLEHGQGLYAVCANDGCEGAGHISCWSRHLIGEGDAILPRKGRCPKCGGEVIWGDMMKELTLRERDQKEVDKLLKEKTKKKRAKT